MAIDWDAELLSPVMAVFGEGLAAQSSTWPIYQQPGGAPFALADAVFDRAYTEVSLDGDDAGATTRKPCLGVRTTLFPAEPAQNDLVYIPSVGLTFVVSNVEPDGHGHAKLILMLTARPPLVLP